VYNHIRNFTALLLLDLYKYFIRIYVSNITVVVIIYCISLFFPKIYEVRSCFLYELYVLFTFNFLLQISSSKALRCILK